MPWRYSDRQSFHGLILVQALIPLGSCLIGTAKLKLETVACTDRLRTIYGAPDKNVSRLGSFMVPFDSRQCHSFWTAPVLFEWVDYSVTWVYSDSQFTPILSNKMFILGFVSDENAGDRICVY